jgi:hypothetical protein
MNKKLLLPLIGILFAIQTQKAFSQYTITATETVYSGGMPTTT